MPLKRGDTIGSYQVTKDFGSANSGQGEWGFAAKGGREFFVKRFLAPVYPGIKAPGTDEGKQSRIQDCEAFQAKQNSMIKALNACGDGGIVVKTKELILSGNEVAKNFYKVSEKVDTSSLSDKVHTLEPKDRLFLMMTAAGGIKILHKNGIIHLDIKPDNILIQSYNERLVAKIIDFDSSILVGEKADPETLVGDFIYYAPEFANFIITNGDTKPPGKPADVFSLGLVFSGYWWGKSPTFSDDYSYACQAILDGDSLSLPYDRTNTTRSRLRMSSRLKKSSGRSLTARPADPMEGGIIRLIEKMLAPEPEKRPTMPEVHKTVSKLYHTK